MALLLFFIVCLSTSSTIYWDGHHMVPFLSSAFFCFFFFLWNKVVESLEWGVFLQIAYAVPHIYLIVIQLFGATDSAQLFFGTLERKNSELSSFIKEKKKVSHQSTWEIITRGLFFLFLGVALGFLSLLPTIGYFAYPVGSIITNFATVGPEVAVVFGFLSLIPQINPYCGLLFQVILVTYNTSKNLLRPYTSRSSKEQVDYLNERYFGSLLGFSAPFCLMMYIPIIGMFLYPLSQAACSSLLLNILRRNQGKEKDHMALMGEEFVKPKKID